LFVLFSVTELIEMKRTFALLVCAAVVLVCNTAEARRNRNSGGNYYQPVQAAPVMYQTTAVPKITQPVSAAAVSTASHSTSKATTTASFSTATAQGVANIMAASGRVGHWGGNTGYEGCGMGATPQAAYNTCCYANSGMATVDVGYAQGSNGWWYCCRRYR
jgi:hypothetical protein